MKAHDTNKQVIKHVRMSSLPGSPRTGPLFHMLMTRTQDLLIISRSARLRDTSSLFDGVFIVEVRA